MESPNAVGSLSGQSSRSRSSTKLADDLTSLTSFNPFSEEDEHDQSSYTLVTSIFSRMKNTLSAPLSSAVGVSTSTSASHSTNTTTVVETRRPSYTAAQTGSSTFSSRTNASDKPNPLAAAPAQTAPPLVSLTPAESELPTYTVEYDRSSSQINSRVPHSPLFDVGENVPFGTSIPGFPIQDDARSIKTATSAHRSGSVSKVMRRLRGEGQHPYYLVLVSVSQLL
jgi:1-phosphatidylinositol-3-phosphate 5-kinase